MLNVIIIDNSNEVILAFEKLLITFFGTEVQVIEKYNSPLLALEELKSLKVDIIFLDVEMPELNGFEFISHLPNELKKKVILVTAHEKFVLNAIKENVTGFITKPIILSELKHYINKVKNDIISNNINITENNMIMIVGHDKTQFFNFLKISRVQANGNYCVLYYEEKQIHCK
jgi:two-component system LytT family response regulator